MVNRPVRYPGIQQPAVRVGAQAAAEPENVCYFSLAPKPMPYRPAAQRLDCAMTAFLCQSGLAQDQNPRRHAIGCQAAHGGAGQRREFAGWRRARGFAVPGYS